MISAYAAKAQLKQWPLQICAGVRLKKYLFVITERSNIALYLGIVICFIDTKSRTGLLMLLYYNGNSKSSGIYEIRNRHTNRTYIGQAKRFNERWNSHRYSFISDTQQNKFLKNDFKKCFEQLNHDDFLEFHILEVMDNSTKEERNNREEYWIKAYKANDYKLYNTKETVGAEELRCWSSHPEETRKKLSIAAKGRILSEETKNKMRLKALGKHHSKESKEKMSKSRSGTDHHLWGKFGVEHYASKTYDIILLSPSGEKFGPIISVNRFAKIHNLDHSHLYRLIKGKQKSHRGWTVTYRGF
jgi:group I intron endonuclease